MATIRTSLKDLPGKLREMSAQRVRKVEQAIRVECRTSGLRLVQEEVDATRPRPPVSDGIYRKAFQVRDIPGGAAIFNPLAYASVIEHGRRPGARPPPSDKLVQWVLRKGLVRATPRRDRQAAARGLAFVIARAIGKRGLPPKRVLGRTASRLRPEILSAVLRALKA